MRGSYEQGLPRHGRGVQSGQSATYELPVPLVPVKGAYGRIVGDVVWIRPIGYWQVYDTL